MVIGGVHFTTDESESITQVVVNEGTEDEKVLQVGGGNEVHLYRHDMYIFYGTNYVGEYWHFTLYTSSSENINNVSKLYDTIGNKYIPCIYRLNGVPTNNYIRINTFIHFAGMPTDNTGTFLHASPIYYNKTSQAWVATTSDSPHYNTNISSMNDTVTQIF